MKTHADLSIGGLSTGRKRIDIDQDAFEKLCELQCTLIEIAGFFRCSEDTIERWCKRTYGEKFADAYKKYAQIGKSSLRRMQYQVAMNGNPTMLIWLGRQYLGQDEHTQETGDSGVKIIDDM